MRRLSKKAKEHLFLIFLLGGLLGVLDGRSGGIEQFVGNGIAMMGFAMAIGLVIDMVMKKVDPVRVDEMLLDHNSEQDIQARQSLRKFKYGIYVALFFVLIELFNNLRF